MGLALATLFARFGTRRVLQAVLFTLPVALVLYALAPTLPLAVVAIFGVGALYLGSLSSFTTVAQLRAPPELRGRVVSVLMMLIGALYPIGSIAQGAIADEIGLRATTTGAAVLLGALLLTWRVLRPRAADAIGDTITAAASTGGRDAVVSPVPEPTPARSSDGG
jgi:predicted MFS family arabinose efflux permease